MDQNMLIVPISLKALVVYDEAEVSALDLRTRLENDSILGVDLQYDTAEVYEGDEMSRGVHLYWTLPKLLKHGKQTDSGKTIFPKAPNRWMIIRYATDILRAEELDCKTYYVGSDIIDDDPNKSKNWVVINDNNGSRHFEFKGIGKSKSFDNEDFTGEAVDLTALSPTNPYFASIYGECKDVFSFHDELDQDHDGKTYSYLIVGWYSNLADDYINIDHDEFAIDTVNKLWRLDDGQAIDNDRSIYSAAIQGVRFSKDMKSGVPTADVELYVGNTTSEALSAMITSKHSGESMLDAETYLNALQNHLMDDDNPPSVAKMKALNHAASFTSKNRGSRWQIEKSDKNYEGRKDERPYFPDDTSLLSDLKLLNKTQREYDDACNRQDNHRQRLYFNWYKTAMKDDGSTGVPGTVTAATLSLEKKTIETEINTINSQVRALNDKIEQLIKEISAYQYLKDGVNADYRLIKSAGSGYSMAKDLGVVLYGSGLGDVGSYYQYVRDSIKCRTLASLQNTFQLSDGIKIDLVHEFPIDFTNYFDHSIFPADAIQSLLVDALLLDSGMHLLIASLIKKVSPDPSSIIIKNFIEKEIIPALAQRRAGTESFAIQKHTQAWEPIFMLWDIGYKPNQGNGTITCHGISPMTNGAMAHLTDIIREDLSMSTDDTSNIEASYQNVLAQNFGGLHKQIVAQLPCLQLPPIAYAKNTPNGDRLGIDDKFLNTLGNTTMAYRVACEPNATVFDPLINGSITIRKLSIVDAYGQEKQIVNESTKNMMLGLSDNISSVPQIKISDGIPLQSKINHPARIDFSWVSTHGDTINQDYGKIEHPIIGWLIPNYLDRQIMLYSNDGQEYKTIRAVKGKGNVEEYYPSQDQILSVKDIKETRQRTVSPVLQNLAKHLDVAKIISDAQALNEKLSRNKTVPSVDTVNLLYGAPIAIAQGKLSIHLLGDGLLDPRWSSDLNKVISLGEKQIKVKIGRPDLEDDGLLGYYIEDDYTKLYGPGSMEHLLAIGSEIKVTLLMNAKNNFYVDSGSYLPIYKVAIPQHAVEALTHDINVSFMLSPILTDTRNKLIPMPATVNKNWYWLEKKDKNQWYAPLEMVKEHADQHYAIPSMQLSEGWIKVDTSNKISNDA